MPSKFDRCVKAVRRTVKARKGSNKESAAIAICTKSVLHPRGRTLKRYRKGRLTTQRKFRGGDGAADAKELVQALREQEEMSHPGISWSFTFDQTKAANALAYLEPKLITERERKTGLAKLKSTLSQKMGESTTDEAIRMLKTLASSGSASSESYSFDKIGEKLVNML